jgi:hypothetical protein
MANQLSHGTWIQEDGTEVAITTEMIGSALRQAQTRPGVVPDHYSLTLFHVIPSRNVKTRSFQDNFCVSHQS